MINLHMDELFVGINYVLNIREYKAFREMKWLIVHQTSNLLLMQRWLKNHILPAILPPKYLRTEKMMRVFISIDC